MRAWGFTQLPKADDIDPVLGRFKVVLTHVTGIGKGEGGGRPTPSLRLVSSRVRLMQGLLS